MEYTNTQNLTRLATLSPKLPRPMQEAIEAKAAKFFDSLTCCVKEFMCSDMCWEQLSIDTHSEEEIRTLFQCLPETLDYDHGYGNLPIHYACDRPKTVPFVPVLAEVGLRHDVGGLGMRGGMLMEDANDDNVLRILSCVVTEEVPVYLDVMKRLRGMGLFEKEDIKEFELCWKSQWCDRERFDYVVDWDPTELRSTYEHGRCILHYYAEIGYETAFTMTLQAAMRHYPRELGLLFLRDTTSSKNTPLALAKKKWDARKSWEIIKNGLEEAEPAKILVKSKKTNMYPFMLAAAGASNDLNLVYYLTRRNPLTLVLERQSFQRRRRSRRDRQRDHGSTW